VSKNNLELAVTGDFMISHEFSPNQFPFKRIFEVLKRADLVFANLETPLGREGYPREKMFAFMADPALARVVQSTGVDVVSLANNHMLDYGEQGLVQTLDALSRTGVPHVGAGRNIREASKPVFLEKNGVRIAFLGYAATLPLGAAASKDRPGIAPVHVTTSYEMDATLLQEQPGNPPIVRTSVDAKDERRICGEIRKARKRADHVIVGIHWGVAFINRPQEYQQPLARKMIEAGASLIVGHHPHMRHHVERHKNGVILYSLGDFVFHDRVDMTGESGMLATVALDKEKIRAVRLWPISVHEKLGLPTLGKESDAKLLLKEMKTLNPRETFTLDQNTLVLKVKVKR
jgi:poly-gamma-glutamate synthesis protein (capsule biosynthesis protein)